jgi:hypothetical protein
VDHIGKQIDRIDRNMKLNTADPIAQYGFTQIPNFILRDPNVSIGAKTIYSLLLSYAWHNDLCFPDQDRLAKDVGMGIASVNRFIKELEGCSLIEIERRGQGKTNFYTVNFVVRSQKRKSRFPRAEIKNSTN